MENRVGDLRQHQGETPEQWLARLRQIDPSVLPPHGRCALALSIGYARHLIRKDRRERLLCLPGGGGDGVACAASPGEWNR
jgi:hypothetical protein